MKQTTLGKLKDNKSLKLRRYGPTYTITKKLKGGLVEITSSASGRTYTFPTRRKCWILIK